MSGMEATQLEAIEIGDTGLWIASIGSAPDAVRRELAEFSSTPSRTSANRGAVEVASALGAIIASGVIGNAAYDAIPLTAAYLRKRFAAGADRGIDHAAAVDTVTAAARSAYGANAAVHIDRAAQLTDGSWDVTFSVNGSALFARVQRDGRLVLWTT
jgi:hypothetical protein